MKNFVKKSLLLLSAICFSTSLLASDCSWGEKDCVADNLAEVADGTFAEGLVRKVTDEIRDIGSEESSD
jgi:hypothetical protein